MDSDVDDALLFDMCQCKTCVHGKCLERLIRESNRTTCGVCRSQYDVSASRVRTHALTAEGALYILIMGAFATVCYPFYISINQYFIHDGAFYLIISVLLGSYASSMLCVLLIATHMLVVRRRWHLLVVKSKLVSVSLNV